MTDYQKINELLCDMSAQIREFGSSMGKLYVTQQKIENANCGLEKFMNSLSISKEIVTFETQPEPINTEIKNNTNSTIGTENDTSDAYLCRLYIEQPTHKPTGSKRQSFTPISKPTSQKRTKDTMFSLERERNTIPRKFQNNKDIASLEQILRYIATKKKEGCGLKDIMLLMNESTIKCNEYLHALMKVEEIVRSQEKRGFVYSLNPNRYYKFLNSFYVC